MKEVKILEIVSRLNNGHTRTVHAITSLDGTLTELCRLKSIPMLSITTAKESAPMKVQDAIDYVLNCQTALVLDPNIMWIKTTFSIENNAA